MGIYGVLMTGITLASLFLTLVSSTIEVIGIDFITFLADLLI